MLAEIEVNLDYPEYDFEEVTLDKCGIVVGEVIDKLEKLIDSFSMEKYYARAWKLRLLENQMPESLRY